MQLNHVNLLNELSEKTSKLIKGYEALSEIVEVDIASTPKQTQIIPL